MTRLVFSLILLLGGYNCFAQASLTRQKAIEDIDFYIRAMEDSHYDPFMYISRKDYYAHIGEIKNSISDSISFKDFVFLFYKVTALLNDAHSTPQLGQPLFQEEFKKEQFFPYKLAHEKNKIYAPARLAADLGIPAGVEIIDINGENLSALFKQVQNRIAGTPSFREEVSCKLLCYFLFLRNTQPPFILGYREKGGAPQKVEVKTGVPFRKALSASMPHIIKPYDWEILQNKLGYIDVRSLSGDVESFGSFLDTCFLKFKQANISNVVIDLRKNSGGNTMLGDLLFSYITNKKYSWGTKSWKISETYKNYLKAGGDTASPYLKEPVNSIWAGEDNCVPQTNQFRNDALFEGNVFFITGPFTFSSAMAVADVVKEYKIGTIIGEPTGEFVKDFGEAFVINLPNSNIKIQSTSSFSHGVNCNKKQNGPVLPDIVVRNTLQDQVFKKDKVLEYLLDRIK